MSERQTRDDSVALLAEQRDFYRADAAQSDRWLSSLIDLSNHDADAETYRRGRQHFVDHVSEVGSLGRVLEIAAGTGRLAELYRPFAESVVLVDSSPESLAVARDRLLPSTAPDLTMAVADIFDWNAGGRTFDTIIFSAWLHHIPHDRFDLFWATVEALLAPGGAVVFDFLDARLPSPGLTDIPQVPTDEYTFYAPVEGFSIRDLQGGRWRVIHNLWDPAELKHRLDQLGCELTVLGPGLLTNMFWATVRR